jgi:hypothetical protein
MSPGSRQADEAWRDQQPMAPLRPGSTLGVHSFRRPEVFTPDAIADLSAVLAKIDAPSSSTIMTGLSLLIVAVTLYVDRRMADRR